MPTQTVKEKCGKSQLNYTLKEHAVSNTASVKNPDEGESARKKLNQRARFPGYPEVQCPYKSFYKLKWHKGKEQSPLIYMRPFLSTPRPKNNLF